MTPPPVFFDTNVLVYAFEFTEAKTPVAARLLAEGGVVSVQVLNEFAAAMRRKFRRDLNRTQKLIDEILRNCPDPRSITLETHRAGMRLCQRYGFSIYDGTVVASALETGCRVLYTEDLQHGQVIDGLRIENPFVEK